MGDDEVFEAEVCDSLWERFLPACNGCGLLGSLPSGGDCCEFSGFAKGEPVGKL